MVYMLRCQDSGFYYYTVDSLVFFVYFVIGGRFNPYEELRTAVYSTLGHCFPWWTVKFICLDFASLLG